GTEGTMRAEPIDWSMSGAELSLLAALAPLAGGSPRAVKRFVNLYRIARPQAPDHKGALALMLALQQGGTDGELAALRDALGEHDGDADLTLQDDTPRLFAALRALEAQGKVSVTAARRTAAVAKRFSLRT
ncbi:MAG: hypothetical protein ACRECE_10855, partial [Xanthobacteraceae bacterium]